MSSVPVDAACADLGAGDGDLGCDAARAHRLGDPSVRRAATCRAPNRAASGVHSPLAFSITERTVCSCIRPPGSPPGGCSAAHSGGLPPLAASPPSPPPIPSSLPPSSRTPASCAPLSALYGTAPPRSSAGGHAARCSPGTTGWGPSPPSPSPPTTTLASRPCRWPSFALGARATITTSGGAPSRSSLGLINGKTNCKTPTCVFTISSKACSFMLWKHSLPLSTQ